MFIVLLRFAENKERAGALMDAHNQWIRRGFDDRVFVVAGTLQPKQGGAILAHGTRREDLESRVNDDPFVAEGVVRAEILEVTPGRTDERLAFLLG